MKIKEISRYWHTVLEHKLRGWAHKQGLDKNIIELNERANTHPKRTAIMLLSVVLVILFLGFVPIFFKSNDLSDAIDLAPLEATAPPLKAAQRIEDVKALQSSSIRDYLSQGQTLKHELDSLLAITHKSSRDSLEIIRKHKQLEYIVNNLNEKD